MSAKSSVYRCFPLWRKFMLISSSNSSYMWGGSPNKFFHLKLSFFDLAFMPSLHVSLVKVVMRGNIITRFLHNFQSVFLGYSYNHCQFHRWPYYIYWDNSLYAINKRKGLHFCSLWFGCSMSPQSYRELLLPLLSILLSHFFPISSVVFC